MHTAIHMHIVSEFYVCVCPINCLTAYTKLHVSMVIYNDGYSYICTWLWCLHSWVL